MIDMAWDTFDDATCTAFNVYRAVPGFIVDFPNSLAANDTLVFSATSPTIQKISFPTVTIDAVVAQFNDLALGIVATKNQAGNAIIFRLSGKRHPRLKLYACTFLTDTGEVPRTIVPRLEWELVGTVTFVSGTTSYTFSDADGTEYDSYRITSVVGSTESLPSLVQAPQIGTSLLCAIEGRVVANANNPVHHLEVRAKIQVPMDCQDGHGIDGKYTFVYTDLYGRFTIYLPRCKGYLLQIPAVGYNESIIVPDQASANFLDIVPTLANDFSPFGDPE